MKRIEIRTGVMATQARGCLVCIHIGTVALYLGRRRGLGARLELLTPLHVFRFSRGSKAQP